MITAGWFGERPARHEIKGWQSRRLAREAFALIQEEQWKEATEKARDAFQLDPTEIETWRTISRLFSRTGQHAPSLEWWKKIEDAGRLTLEDRREYAASALAAGELTAAARQIDPLLAQPGDAMPGDHLFAGQLAVRRGDGARAIDYAEGVLRDNRAKPFQVLSGATLILAVASPESSAYGGAWKQIEDLARDPTNEASLETLALLAQQAPPGSAPAEDVSTSLSLAQSSDAHGRTLPAAEVAHGLDRHPKARPYHHLLALKLRAREEPARAGELLDQAIERFRGGDDETLIALGTWIFTQGRYQTLLDALPLERALRRRELYLQYLDALAALGRFEEVRNLLKSEKFRLDPVSQHMYLATARERLGEEAGTANEWQRALEAANDVAKCMALGAYAERADANEIADAAYAQAIGFAPNTRGSYEARLRVARTRGETAKAREIVAEIVRLWPDDHQARNDANYLDLLLGSSGDAAENATQEAQALVAREPQNWQARATAALGHLRLGRPAAALQAFAGVRATGLEPPGALAVRAVALDANGWKEGARGDAHNLGAAHLLPEERTLIAPLLTDAPN